MTGQGFASRQFQSTVGGKHFPAGTAMAIAEAQVPIAPRLDPRVPMWSMDRLTTRPCPVCGSSEFVPLVRRPDRLLVGTCCICHLHYLPAIPLDELSAFYARYSETHQRWASRKTVAAALRAASRRAGRNGLVNEIARRRRFQGQRLLELGCSTGSFLLDARSSGAIVSGVELDRAAQAFVSADLRIPCFASIEDARARGPFDTVVALNIIEHLPTPSEWLRDIAGVLAPGGLVVILTPNGGQADVLGAGWVGFRVDLDHLNYFSSRTLSRLLVSAGMWPEAVWEFKQAELSAFRASDTVQPTLLSRLLRLGKQADRAWAFPQFGGSYVLCTFASVPSAEDVGGE